MQFPTWFLLPGSTQAVVLKGTLVISFNFGFSLRLDSDMSSKSVREAKPYINSSYEIRFQHFLFQITEVSA